MRRALLLLGAAAAALVAASVVVYAWTPFADPHPHRADAIVVLAGSKSRLPLALELFRRGIAPAMLVSSDPNDAPRRRFCRLPPSGVRCFRPDPYSTRGEARAVAKIARRRGWRSVVLVTSRFHLFRTRLLFRRCSDVALQLVPAHVTWWRWPLSIASEWMKLGAALTTRRGC